MKENELAFQEDEREEDNKKEQSDLLQKLTEEPLKDENTKTSESIQNLKRKQSKIYENNEESNFENNEGSKEENLEESNEKKIEESKEENLEENNEENTSSPIFVTLFGMTIEVK